MNLHQLRVTPHNLPRVAGKGFTCLHGEKVLVLESELAALSLMLHVADEGIPLGVNYCSFAYKQRWQGAAARRRAAGAVTRPWESLTPAGYIRRLCLSGPAEEISGRAEGFRRAGADPGLWKEEAPGLLYAHPDLLAPGSLDRAELSAAYFEAALVPAVSYRNFFREVRLNANRKIHSEKRPALPRTTVPPGSVEGFLLYLKDPGNHVLPKGLSVFSQFEEMGVGLPEYF